MMTDMRRISFRLFLITLFFAFGTGCRNGYISGFLGDFSTQSSKLTHDSFDNLNPALSPDGKHVVFVSDRSGNYEIWRMDEDGSGLKNLTNHIAVDRYPAWSPDGKKIAFSSTRSGNWDVWIMNADGSGSHPLTNHRMADLSPAWSRDGSKIAFVSYRDLEYSIYMMDADGQNQRKLTTGGNGDWGPAFSPDGQSIAFASSRSGGGDIYLIDTETGTQYRRLTDNPARDMLPAWSPDGKKIAFVSERGGDRDLWLINSDGSSPQPLTRGIFKQRRPLYDVDREFIEGLGYYLLSWSQDGSKIAYTSVRRDGKGDIAMLSIHSPYPNLASLQVIETQITQDDGWELFPSWSPDGKQIAYVKTQGQGFSEIWVMDPNGQNRRRLTDRPFTKFFEPSFSPDQKILLFFSNQSGNDDIWTMDRTGQNLKQLTTDPAADFHPSWSPDGKKIAFISKRTGANAIWIMDRNGKNQEQLVTVGMDDCDLTPSWSPDGKKLIFSARKEASQESDPTLNCAAFSRTKPPFTTSCPSHIWEVDIETRQVGQLTFGDFHDGRVAVHPDGSLIAFTSNRGDSWNLWLMDRERGNLRRLTEYRGYNGYSTWSPDGKKIVYVSDQSGDLDLWLLTFK
jgi:TolB protein